MNSRKLALHFTISALTFTAATFPKISPAKELTANEIMEKSEDARRTQDMQATATLITVKGDGAKKEKSFTFWRKVKTDGVRFNTLTRFHAPAEVKDEAILFLENAEGANDIFLYLPTYKKVRRVERTQQSGSFMGSDLSYSDLTTQHTDDYVYELAKEEACPTEEAKGVTCFVIRVKPKTDALRERTGYTSGSTWIRKDTFMGVRAVYQDETGKDFKEIESAKIQVVDTATKKYFAHELRVKNLKTGGSTSVSFTKVKANAGISDAVFTQQNLTSGK